MKEMLIDFTAYHDTHDSLVIEELVRNPMGDYSIFYVPFEVGPRGDRRLIRSFYTSISARQTWNNRTGAQLTAMEVLKHMRGGANG